jgi:acid phosphatase (class B)
MRKITLALSAACLLFSLNSAVVARASAPTPVYTGTTAAILAEQAPIHWVSVAQIENSLMGRPPMAVGLISTTPSCSQARASGAVKKCTHRTAKPI